MHRVAFYAIGEPAPKGNHRVNRATRRLYDAARGLEAWEATVREAAGQAMAGAGHLELLGPAVSLGVTFVLPRETTTRTGKTRRANGYKDPWPMSKDDLDKLLRAVGDAMAGVVYEDDAQIVELCAKKRWAFRGEAAGASVVVEEVAG